MRFQLETLRRGIVQSVSVSAWPVKGGGGGDNICFSAEKNALPTARTILIRPDNWVKM